MSRDPDQSDHKRPVSSGSIDRLVAELAGRQQGFVAARQLRALGMERRAVARRVHAGRLHPHPYLRGVFAVGHRVITQRGWWMAAILDAGPGAVLSHRSAAALWGLGFDRRMRVEVTTPKDLRRTRYDVVVSQIAEDERTVRDGIPVTTVARTLLDLATVVRDDQLERAMREAEVRGLGDRTPLVALLARHRGRRGTAVVRAILDRKVIGSGRTKSELEEACDDEEPFDTDRRRDRMLQARGWRTVRVTWRQLEEDAHDLEADLRALLASTTL